MGKIKKYYDRVPLYKGSDSTLLSWNGTCPESPDGKRLIYTRMEGPVIDGPKMVRGELWMCNTDLSNHQKLQDLHFYIFTTNYGFQHNGAMASWIDNKRVVFRDHDDAKHKIKVMDSLINMDEIKVINVETKEILYGPITGDIGHAAVQKKVPFGIRSFDLEENPEYPEIKERGIYELDCDTGEIRLIVSTSEIFEYAKTQGLTPRDKTKNRSENMAHITFNPSATHILARWLFNESNSLIITDLEGKNKVLFRNKPLHQLWYDDDTLIAVDRRGSEGICRFKKDGTKMETLAGPGNHIDLSPDKKLFVGDKKNGVPLEVRLYKRGRLEPDALLERNFIGEPVTKYKAHPNPTFSRDGKRVYFTQIVSNDKVRAVYVDISELID